MMTKFHGATKDILVYFIVIQAFFLLALPHTG